MFGPSAISQVRIWLPSILKAALVSKSFHLVATSTQKYYVTLLMIDGILAMSSLVCTINLQGTGNHFWLVLAE